MTHVDLQIIKHVNLFGNLTNITLQRRKMCINFFVLFVYKLSCHYLWYQNLYQYVTLFLNRKVWCIAQSDPGFIKNIINAIYEIIFVYTQFFLICNIFCAVWFNEWIKWKITNYQLTYRSNFNFIIDF